MRQSHDKTAPLQVHRKPIAVGSSSENLVSTPSRQPNILSLQPNYKSLLLSEEGTGTGFLVTCPKSCFHERGIEDLRLTALQMVSRFLSTHFSSQLLFSLGTSFSPLVQLNKSNESSTLDEKS